MYMIYKHPLSRDFFCHNTVVLYVIPTDRLEVSKQQITLNVFSDHRFFQLLLLETKNKIKQIDLTQT